MTLKRKVRKVGNSLVVSIPSQVAEMAGFKQGDEVEFEYLGMLFLRFSEAQHLGAIAT